MKVTNKTWLISDTHFGHRKIIIFQQRPESHEVIMLSNWIKYVGEDDYLLHLGDVFMGKQGNPERWARVISRLPGRKYLIKGNHDKAKDKLYDLAGFTVIDPFITKEVVFTNRPVSEEYPAPEGEWHTNIHGHVHANPYTPKHDGTMFDDKKYVNVSVEVTGLGPIRLGSVCPLK